MSTESPIDVGRFLISLASSPKKHAFHIEFHDDPPNISHELKNYQ